MVKNEQFDEAVSLMREASCARKCWMCGCYHGALDGIEDAIPESERPNELAQALREGQANRQATKYDCLGCEVCWPALAVNALQVDEGICPSANVPERQGWPPFAGDYAVVQYNAPVAVCTLTDDSLMTSILDVSPSGLSIVGTLQTENLGIERIIRNVLANPNIRFLIVCGADSHQAVGHLPGQSLDALYRFGLDKDMRIRGAKGKRPRLRNLPLDAVEHFRDTVEIINMVGNSSVPEILVAIDECVQQELCPAEPYAVERAVATVTGYLPEQVTPDSAGYFVLYTDQVHRCISLEHYRKDGILDTVIEGRTAAELYTAAIDRKLVTRLDHAAYLGRELARAEIALRTGERYVQDGAPERQLTSTRSACGCCSSGRETTR